MWPTSALSLRSPSLNKTRRNYQAAQMIESLAWTAQMQTRDKGAIRARRIHCQRLSDQTEHSSFELSFANLIIWGVSLSFSLYRNSDLGSKRDSRRAKRRRVDRKFSYATRATYFTNRQVNLIWLALKAGKVPWKQTWVGVIRLITLMN